MILKVIQNRLGPDMTLEFHGPLDENGELPNLSGEISGRLEINLEHLTMINSLGCRNWVNWIKTIHAKQGVFLVKCSPPFVTQVNILHGFIPKGVTIESFFVPYYCEPCEYQENVLVHVDKEHALPSDDRTCPKCQGAMELDVVKTIYFRFLQKKSA